MRPAASRAAPAASSAASSRRTASTTRAAIPLFPPGATGTTGTATNSYWDTQTTGQSTSAGGTGQTSAQLVNVIPNGFATGAWTTSAGSYPFLAGQPNPLPVPGDPGDRR